MKTQSSAALSLDLRDLPSPLPVAKVAVAMASLHPGELVEVLATGPAAIRDFAVWCLATGNELLDLGEDAGTFRFVIQKR
jgi:tRNA 2-thiouridine synthesizing protein A